MIIADTNLISYLFLTGPSSDVAEQVLQKDPEWVAPLLWKSEFRNVLALYVRQEILTLNDSITIFDAALELMTGHEYEIVSHRVVQLAYENSCSAYDCEFVVLAEELQVPLVTADKKLLKAFPAVTRSPQQFCTA